MNFLRNCDNLFKVIVYSQCIREWPIRPLKMNLLINFVFLWTVFRIHSIKTIVVRA